MKVQTFFAWIMFSMCFTSLADTLTWKAGATGGWSDPNSYVGGAAPDEGDVVLIPANVTVTINDDDIATVNKLNGIVISNNTSKIAIDVESDHDITCSIAKQENGTSYSGSVGVIEKSGGGMVGYGQTRALATITPILS